MTVLSKKTKVLLALPAALACAAIIEALAYLISGGADKPELMLTLTFAAAIFGVFALCVLLEETRTEADTLSRAGEGLKNWMLRHPAVPAIAYAALFVVSLALQVNNSSMACYRGQLTNNVYAAHMYAVGYPREIRSDEYLVSTAQFFHDSYSGILKTMWAQCDSPLEVINLVIAMLNPFKWGELYMPASYAFSWKFLLGLTVSLAAFFRMFRLLTGKSCFSFFAALLIIFSPGVQWWSGPRSFALMCAMILLFHDFFVVKKTWLKLLVAWGLVSVTATILADVYPAWDFPLMYMMVLLLIGVYAAEKKLEFKKTDIPFIVVTVLLMAAAALGYLKSSGEETELMLNTVYPGRRFSAGGGIAASYWSNYLAMPFIPWRELNIPGTNQSEISSFIHLFPLPLLIYALDFRELKKHRTLTALVIFNIFCIVYMTLGIGDTLAKYTLFSYTTPQRLATVWGYDSFIMLLLECFWLSPAPRDGGRGAGIIRCAVLNACMLAFLVYTALSCPELVSYMGATGYVCTCAAVLLLSNLLLFGNKRAFITLLCAVTIVSGAVVNPINLGAGAIQNTPIAREIREIDAEDSGRWLVLNSFVIPKYVYAQGVDCVNFLSWPPRFDLFRPLDTSGENENVYNRYAHVSVSLTDGETQFRLAQDDLFYLDMNADDLAKWELKYILVQFDELESTKNVHFELIYHDELDGINIYKVS